MKKIWTWIKDVNGYALLIVIPLFLYLIISGFTDSGIFNNFYSRDAAQTPVAWKIGSILFLVLGIWFVEKIDISDSVLPWLIGAIIIFFLCGMIGFNFQFA